MAVANCPSCGGQINFAIGSSAVVICDYCHSVVARTDRGLEDLGKVAALIDTGRMIEFLNTLFDGLRNAALMAYQVWWALVLGFAISAVVQAWVPRTQMAHLENINQLVDLLTQVKHQNQ